MLSGRAGQGGGLYLFGILIPVIVFWKVITVDRRFARNLGIAILSCYFIYPVIDIFINFFDSHTTSLVGELKWSKVIRSLFSSSFGITGVFCLIFSFKSKQEVVPRKPDIDVWDIFLRSLSIATVILIIFSLVQLTTGYHYSEMVAYRPDRVMGNGFYRLTGFSSHPIAFAGFSLTLFAFFWTLFWNHSFQNGLNKLESRLTLFLSLSYFILAIGSGSRIAALLALGFLLLIPWLSPVLDKKKKLTLTAVGLIAFLGLAFATGILDRFKEIFSASITGGLGERVFFWEVHWKAFLESPIYGHGHYFLNEMRPILYEKYGFGSLDKKYNAHNLYLETLAAGGVVASLVILAFFSRAVIYWRTCLKKSSQSYFFKPWLMALTIQLCFGLTQNSLYDSAVMLTFITLSWMIFWQGILSKNPR